MPVADLAEAIALLNRTDPVVKIEVSPDVWTALATEAGAPVDPPPVHPSTPIESPGVWEGPMNFLSVPIYVVEDKPAGWIRITRASER